MSFVLLGLTATHLCIHCAIRPCLEIRKVWFRKIRAILIPYCRFSPEMLREASGTIWHRKCSFVAGFAKGVWKMRKMWHAAQWRVMRAWIDLWIFWNAPCCIHGPIACMKCWRMQRYMRRWFGVSYKPGVYNA